MSKPITFADLDRVATERANPSDPATRHAAESGYFSAMLYRAIGILEDVVNGGSNTEEAARHFLKIYQPDDLGPTRETLRDSMPTDGAPEIPSNLKTDLCQKGVSK